MPPLSAYTEVADSGSRRRGPACRSGPAAWWREAHGCVNAKLGKRRHGIGTRCRAPGSLAAAQSALAYAVYAGVNAWPERRGDAEPTRVRAQRRALALLMDRLVPEALGSSGRVGAAWSRHVAHRRLGRVQTRAGVVQWVRALDAALSQTGTGSSRPVDKAVRRVQPP